MRLAALVCLLATTGSVAEARRVKTPKSANARAEVATHRAHGKHIGKKVKTRRSQGAKRERIN